MAKVFDSAKKIITGIADKGGDVGGWLNIVENIFTFMGRKSARPDDTEAGIKSGFMGIGSEDEALFWDAVALAFQGDRGIKQKTQKIRKIFVRLDLFQKKRLFQTVGIDEQSITETEPVSVEYTDAKGNTRQKIEKKEKKYKINERGKRFIQFLAQLEVKEAVGFLKASGTLTGPIDDLKYFWNIAQPFLQSIRNIEVRRRVQVAILWYLGAETLEEAEALVSAKELALANRRQQSWRERERQRPREFWIWISLIIFSVVAFTYVFAFTH
jgi:hypothetical protein